MALFVASADEMYGPITTLRRNNHVVKHIPWSAFKMGEQDWTRVTDARDILGVSNCIFESRPRTHSSGRTLIGSNNISPLKSNQLSGACSLHSKNYKQRGKRSATARDTHYTKTLLTTASRRSVNITHAWTKSQALSLHSVTHFSLPSKICTKYEFEVLHPYYKLAYIKLAWGGPEEQAAGIEDGDPDAKDWQDEARKIVERTVSGAFLRPLTLLY